MLARSALQQPATQQRRPGLPTNNPVHRKVLVGLESPDGLLGLGAEVAVHRQLRGGASKAPDEVQYGLQPLDRWTTEDAVAQHRQAERYLHLGLRSTHCGFPPSLAAGPWSGLMVAHPQLRSKSEQNKHPRLACVAEQASTSHPYPLLGEALAARMVALCLAG